MRNLFTVALVLCAAGVLVVGLRAQAQGAKKEVTVKGTILCAHCALKETKRCVTQSSSREGAKVITYYLDDKGDQEGYHDAVCGGERREGIIIGIVAEKNGRRWIRPTKVEYLKK